MIDYVYIRMYIIYIEWLYNELISKKVKIIIMLILKIMIRCDKLRGNGLNDKLNVYLYIYMYNFNLLEWD